MTSPDSIKHTADWPWTVTDNSWEVSSVYDVNGDLVAQVRISDEVDEDTQDQFEAIKEAKARLIAAAPELLDVLVLALPFVEEAEPDPAYDKGAVRKVINLMTAAIAKAEGRIHQPATAKEGER